ncbi:MAG TPA: glycosyltransferase [Candidatus Paceibacterota bacterium]
MISGDRNILVRESKANTRLELQRAQVERLDVFVWPQVHSWREILLAAQKNAYDIVTAQDPFLRGLLAWRIARRTGAKLNLQIHTDLSAQSLTRRILAHFLLRKADSVRVVSQKIKDFLKPFNLHATVSVLPIYVNLAPFRGLPHRPHPRFKKTLLWIGRFEPEKDPLFALSILADVRNSGMDAGLILLGAGSLEKMLRARAKSLMPFVEFPGWQNPIPYLEVADVVVSTSKHESYGASTIEALAAGVPVVSPDIGIAKEAGAIVAERQNLSVAVCKALRSNERGKLFISVPNQDEWAKQWLKSLISSP